MGFVVMLVFTAAVAAAPASVARSKGYGFGGWFAAAFFILTFAFLANVLIGIAALVGLVAGTVAMKDRPPESRAVPYYGLKGPPKPATTTKPPPQVQRLASPPSATSGGKKRSTKPKHQVCTSCDNLIGTGQWAYCPLCGSRDLAFK